MTALIVDHQPVSLESVYGDVEPIAIYPIGHVVKVQGGEGDGHAHRISEIRLLDGMARFMKGLQDESSILVLWHFDRALSVESVAPRGWDGKKVGPFACRTPHRLTPIGATDVELLEVRGTTLVVRGLEAFEGTAVLDIKVSMESLRQDGRRGRRHDPKG